MKENQKLNVYKATDFFSEKVDENTRILCLFGKKADLSGRNKRRVDLIKYLHNRGYEPVPATMAPPYRGLVVDPEENAKKTDENGLEWRDYKIANPTSMSRVFGPLARYQLYESLNENKNWELDFSKPRIAVWEYVCKKYAEIQQVYKFDFMRGDMSHVQMRPEGVPLNVPQYYDLLKSVKQYIQTQNNTPYFAYFAESFLAPPDIISYGNEAEHLVASSAEITLGDLQSTVVGETEFLNQFRYYINIANQYSVTPCFTQMTADKDDPRFDKFYLKGNVLRQFIALFLPNMPSYMALGYEMRDPHPIPVSNEFYTKLYVFQEKEGAKSTAGDYKWGDNVELFQHLFRLNIFYKDINFETEAAEIQWLILPNTVDYHSVISWIVKWEGKMLLFVANLNLEKSVNNFRIPNKLFSKRKITSQLFTTKNKNIDSNNFQCGDLGLQILEILPEEGQVYQLDENT